uniref:phosphoribosylaminoimidazole carboxylase n=1 Tax=Ditylum brightwellii TaxID=49249 RepID=A0A7S1ZTF0_9STRA|mmetsp:Transcript_38053/g.56941  ORF Transcript_38053/g.56941 Transcript_38053/m.56941 type:complete len:357 (+) Transcript_38053:538-1608(+)
MLRLNRLCQAAQRQVSLRIASSSMNPNTALNAVERRTMTTTAVASILQDLQNGRLTASDAEASILHLIGGDESNKKYSVSSSTLAPLESFANLDHSRAKRTGFPEAIFAAGKTPEQIVSILDDMAGHLNDSIRSEMEGKVNCEGEGTRDVGAGNAILATRVDKKLYEQISSLPLQNGTITYHEMARIISMRASALDELESLENDQQINSNTDATDSDQNTGKTRIIVACAGTTDLPVAEEAAITLESIPNIDVRRRYDVGVAGLHRILNALPELRHPDVGAVIVCAGMDGALPSVVAGLVSVPVVAVPTSVGYGAAFGGVSALLTMLNSCAPGVGVVNIDNGFGGAALAYKSCVKR